MPPRRSARVAAVAERASSALSPLPLPLVLHIFSLLPADVRARAACVSRGWCATLWELSLWTRLNLSPSSGVRVRVMDAVLAGASAKARGQLAALDVSGCDDASFDELLPVVRTNGGALRELRDGTRTEQTLDRCRARRSWFLATRTCLVRDWPTMRAARCATMRCLTRCAYARCASVLVRALTKQLCLVLQQTWLPTRRCSA
jgi:hypothetical protein